MKTKILAMVLTSLVLIIVAGGRTVIAKEGGSSSLLGPQTPETCNAGETYTSTGCRVCQVCPGGAYEKSQGNANCNDSPAANAIDLSDYLIWYQEFTQESTTLKADFNCDGTVDLSDYLAWYQGFIAYLNGTLVAPTQTPTPSITNTPTPTLTLAPTETLGPSPTPVPMTGVTDPNVQP